MKTLTTVKLRCRFPAAHPLAVMAFFSAVACSRAQSSRNLTEETPASENQEFAGSADGSSPMPISGVNLIYEQAEIYCGKTGECRAINLSPTGEVSLPTKIGKDITMLSWSTDGANGACFEGVGMPKTGTEPRLFYGCTALSHQQETTISLQVTKGDGQSRTVTKKITPAAPNGEPTGDIALIYLAGPYQGNFALTLPFDTVCAMTLTSPGVQGFVQKYHIQEAKILIARGVTSIPLSSSDPFHGMESEFIKRPLYTFIPSLDPSSSESMFGPVTDNLEKFWLGPYDGTPKNGISMKMGAQLPITAQNIWTGALYAAGTGRVAGNCTDWKDDLGSGIVSFTGASDPKQALGESMIQCSEAAYIYCVAKAALN